MTSSADARGAIAPLRAGWVTRSLYGLALMAFVFGSLSQTWSWIGLATQASIVGVGGRVTYVLLSTALLYRVYCVIAYPAVLDARPPYLLGRLVRRLGWGIMLVCAIGTGAMFFVAPLTRLIFKAPGEYALGSFVVGLSLSVAAGAGWMGCLLFDISKAMGRRVTAPRGVARTRRQRIRDASVLAGLAVLVVALLEGLKLMNGEPCLESPLGRCAAKVEGGASRMAKAAVGAPVALESDIDEIEYRHPDEPAWVLREHPAFSLLKSGHPVAQGAEAGVKVVIHAATAGQGVVMTLAVSENGQQTAQFTTRFESGAHIEPSASGSRKVVVELKKMRVVRC